MRFQNLISIIAIVSTALSSTVLSGTISNYTVGSSATAEHKVSNSNSTISASGCERKVKLFGISDNIGKVGLTNYHEGAGINYLFLTGSDSPTYIYNECTKQIYILLDSTHKQFLNEAYGFVQLTVTGPAGEYGYKVDNGVRLLTLNGSSDGWIACKNTNDPYNISSNLSQLAYRGFYGTQCEQINVEIDY